MSYTCPICNSQLTTTSENEINSHIDECLTKQMLSSDSQNTETSSSYELDSTLARQLLSEEEEMQADYDTEFTVKCPYPACTQQFLDAARFILHARENHSTCDQKIGCPLCFIETNSAFTPNEKTNLLQHLNSTHGELLQIQAALEASKKSLEDHRTYLTKRETEIPTKVSGHYTLQKLEENIERECAICFEEFEKGQSVAWLECFCLYHETCINAWYAKKKMNKFVLFIEKTTANISN